MLNLQQAIEAVAGRAGWSVPAEDAQGVTRVRLEGGLALEFRSPDGRVAVLSADLGEVPGDASPDYWTQLGKAACGCLRRRPSVLSAAGGRFELYRMLDLSRLDADEFASETEGFLNDEAWWAGELESARDSAGTPASGASPFAFGGAWTAFDWKL